MSKSIARKNHILPKKYLSRFAKDERIWVLDFETKQQNNLNIQEAAIIKNFYIAQTVDAKESDTIEQNFLAEIEGKCDPAISEVIENHTFSNGETWDLLANYISLMYCRIPLFRQVFLETYEQMANQMADDLIEDEESYKELMEGYNKAFPDAKKLTYEEAKKSRDKIDISVDIPRTFYIRQMMIYSANLVPIIGNMTPNIFIAPKHNPYKFVTGDVPIIAIPRKTTTKSKWTWINNPDADLYFPISSHYCLVLNYDSLRKCNTISSKRISWINHLVACNCTRIVLSEEESFYWTKENWQISNDVKELVNSWGEEKKTGFRGNLINKEYKTKVRNDWGHLRSTDPVE